MLTNTTLDGAKLRFYANEEFKEITIPYTLQLRYAISNYGRLISFTEQFEDGRFVKGSMTGGYRIFRFHTRIDGKLANKHYFFYKLVAEHFLPKTSENQVQVIHLNRIKDSDHVSNLKWVTKEEYWKFFKDSPAVIEAKKKLIQSRINADGHKLTTTQVMRLKKKLLDPNRKTRLKILAKEFGVSEMQLHRIKTGENWGHIKV